MASLHLNYRLTNAWGEVFDLSYEQEELRRLGIKPGPLRRFLREFFRPFNPEEQLLLDNGAERLDCQIARNRNRYIR